MLSLAIYLIAYGWELHHFPLSTFHSFLKQDDNAPICVCVCVCVWGGGGAKDP